MYKNKKIVALIPLRGGSKSIPCKNIKPLVGKPLCYWTLKAACDSKYIDEVWVSTEDQKIKEVVVALGLPVKIIDRPVEFAQDTSSTESVMLHFSKQVAFDILVTIQATSPLTTGESLDEALNKFMNDGYDSMLTGVVLKRFYWTKDGHPLNYDPLNRPRRQEWDGTVMENGAFYITQKNILDKYRCRLAGKIGVHIMTDETAVEIDEPNDWLEIEKLLSKRPKE